MELSALNAFVGIFGSLLLCTAAWGGGIGLTKAVRLSVCWAAFVAYLVSIPLDVMTLVSGSVFVGTVFLMFDLLILFYLRWLARQLGS